MDEIQAYLQNEKRDYKQGIALIEKYESKSASYFKNNNDPALLEKRLRIISRNTKIDKAVVTDQKKEQSVASTNNEEVEATATNEATKPEKKK